MEPSLENQSSSQTPIEPRLGKCEVCAFHDAKYTCPKCEVKTCSLKCNKIHKLEVECDGLRDRTRFVPINKFSNLDLSSDYRLLEEIARNMETVKKNFGKKDDSRVIPPHLFKLRNAAKDRRIVLKFLPYKFERHRTNTTQLNFRTNIISWHIEFVFVNAEFLKIHENKVPETEKIGSIINKLISNEEDAAINEKLKFYKAADINGVKFLLKAEQKKGKKFYDIDSGMSLKECLAKKLIIEYPTIYVLLKEHSTGFDIIDSDEEDEESNNNNDIKTGNQQVEKILRKAESDESLYRSLKNLLFITEYSDEEMSS
ncbi:box C/D snoRNA protein 1 [Sitophilus oryzae]|uniref:Box C/D snoRNA protein 1 n=1 Tax=Sitophilus oryzae TaxID=7048 RepID=A0A6J2XUI1_SITOR|nr:box C/D snoRNA protein 1 [Sitophilus oryzae]